MRRSSGGLRGGAKTVERIGVAALPEPVPEEVHVAERAQLLEELGIVVLEAPERHGMLPPAGLDPCAQARLHHLEDVRPLTRKIARLAGVLTQIVELARA